MSSCKKNATDCSHCEMNNDEWQCTPITDKPLPCFNDEWKQQEVKSEVRNAPYSVPENCYLNHKGICLDKKPENLADPGPENAPKYYKEDYSDIKQGPNFKYDLDFNCVVRSTKVDDKDFIKLPINTSCGDIKDVCEKTNKVPCPYYGQSRIDLDRHREDMMKDIYANMDDRHCNPQWK